MFFAALANIPAESYKLPSHRQSVAVGDKPNKPLHQRTNDKKQMPKIELVTEINSTTETCFDLSRSIDLHKISTVQTNEEAIGGRTTGLINLNETVTWQATHFGVRQKLTSKVTAFDRPNYFIDEQIKGVFKSIIHEHRFEKVGDKVIMKDIFEFHSPFGFFGKIFNKTYSNGLPKKITNRPKPNN